MAKSFKVVLIGDGGVGKSTFRKYHLTSEFEEVYIPTLGVTVDPIKFDTNCGPITFNVWDCAGQEKFSGLGEGYYISADAALIFFDVTSRISFKNAAWWKNEFKKVCPDAPVILCGNKVDVEGSRKVSLLCVPEGFDYYYDISVKTSYNMDKPFLKLAQIFNESQIDWDPEDVITIRVSKG